MRTVLKITLHGYWHAGSGRGEGPGADASVVRDGAGLPYLPGRTLKGLLREAVRRAMRLGRVPGGAPELRRWFGTELIDDDRGQVDSDDRIRVLEEARFRTDEGALRVSSATIGRGEAAARWRRWAEQAAANGPVAAEVRRRVGHLFAELASTKIDDASGVASDRSLRVIEVAVPMDLYATIEGPDEDPWPHALREALVLLRALGSHRRRGLGWCTCELLDLSGSGNSENGDLEGKS